MFERYQRGQNRFLDRVVDGYDTVRALAKRADQEGAFRFDVYRRRWRQLEKARQLDAYFTETAAALKEIEGELDPDSASALGESRYHVEFALSTLRS